MRSRRVCLLVLAMIGVALVTDEVDARLASNRLASNRLASNRLASNRLASNALTATSLQAINELANFLATEDGRVVYGYMISCALPEGVNLEVSVPAAPDTELSEGANFACQNGDCVFYGNLGLAEYWLDRKLDQKGQRWITACLLARVNLTETAEAISLRGVAPSLSVGGEEAAHFPLQEGAFFGNLFAEGDAIDWNACRGKDKALSPHEGGLFHRSCAEPDPSRPGFTMCGFKYAGDCADHDSAVPTPHACRNFDPEDGTYGDCRAADADGNPTITGSRPYREVITTYVSSGL